MDLELTLHWQSETAGHHDRHFFANVDLAQTDLPPALRAGAASAEIEFCGRPARLEVSDVSDVSPSAVPPAPTLATGYQPLWLAMQHGLAKAADFAALAHLQEPYSRPHEDDATFYAAPRLVDHLDTTAQAHWQRFHGEFLRPGFSVLDLMASHDSHLPDASPLATQPALAAIVGLGMNAIELDANPRLTERNVHDLNANPQLPFADARFDLVFCALSIEYLQRPVTVLRELRRCLKPGAACVISFSERWFPHKAVAPWATLAPFARVAWVLRHLRDAGFVGLKAHSKRGDPRPPQDKYVRQTPLSDPLYAVSGIHPS